MPYEIKARLGENQKQAIERLIEEGKLTSFNSIDEAIETLMQENDGLEIDSIIEDIRKGKVEVYRLVENGKLVFALSKSISYVS